MWEAPTVVSKDSNITVANRTIYDSVNFSPITTINTSLPSWINESSYRDSICVNQTNPAAQFVCPAINTFYNVVTFIDGILYGFETIMLSPFTFFTNAWNWAFGLQENLLSAFAAQISIFVAIASQILNSFPPKVINAFSIFLVLNLVETIINGIRESGG